MFDLNKLKGKKITKIYGLKEYSNYVIILFNDHTGILQFHQQYCCETVALVDVTGDINDIIGHDIICFDERTESRYTKYGHETFTFYTICTVKGYLDFRWEGSSNGCYSESVNVYEIYLNNLDALLHDLDNNQDDIKGILNLSGKLYSTGASILK